MNDFDCMLLTFGIGFTSWTPVKPGGPWEINAEFSPPYADDMRDKGELETGKRPTRPPLVCGLPQRSLPSSEALYVLPWCSSRCAGPHSSLAWLPFDSYTPPRDPPHQWPTKMDTGVTPKPQPKPTKPLSMKGAGVQ